jgi:hypothetical protein
MSCHWDFPVQFEVPETGKPRPKFEKTSISDNRVGRQACFIDPIKVQEPARPAAFIGHEERHLVVNGFFILSLWEARRTRKKTTWNPWKM